MPGRHNRYSRSPYVDPGVKVIHLERLSHNTTNIFETPEQMIAELRGTIVTMQAEIDLLYEHCGLGKTKGEGLTCPTP